MADLRSAIESTATGPKSVSVVGTKVDTQSIYDQVKAGQHLAAKDGVASILKKTKRLIGTTAIQHMT